MRNKRALENNYIWEASEEKTMKCKNMKKMEQGHEKKQEGTEKQVRKRVPWERKNQ